MTNSPIPQLQLRTSDEEREEVAIRLRDAAANGRLTMAEADDRLAAAYAAVTRADLVGLTADLPVPPAPPQPPAPLDGVARRRLMIHAAIVAVMVVNLIVRFVLSGAPFFWPGYPLTMLLGSLVVHYALVRRRTGVQAVSRGTSAA